MAGRWCTTAPGWLREKNLIPLVACEAHRESFYAGLGFQKISEVTVFTG